MFLDLDFKFDEMSLLDLMTYLTDGSNTKIKFAASRYRKISLYIEIDDTLYKLMYDVTNAKLSSFSELTNELSKVYLKDSVKFKNYKIKR